jgi:hypothetical protein
MFKMKHPTVAPQRRGMVKGSLDEGQGELGLK